MPSYQQLILIGHVGRDPDLRYTATGVAVCDFSVAVNRKWTDRTTNERREETTWFRVSAWRNLAEVCHQYVTKGMAVMVAGRVEASAYLGQDGSPRASLDVTATDVQFLGGRGDRSPTTATDEEMPF